MGATLLAHGMSQLGAIGSASVATWVAVALTTIGGASLFAGFLTPFGGALAALTCLAVAVGWLPQSHFGALREAFPGGFVAIVAVALVLTGPGAFSIDARLLGRREIVIPPSRRALDS